ncbi:Thiol-disulfide oxidoreductase ResA [subsurface metagenome]
MRYIILYLIGLTLISDLKAQKVYDFQLETPDGQLKTYTELRGSKITVIDFWATWCKPCVNSIPKLVELSETYPEEEVVFIGIRSVQFHVPDSLPSFLLARYQIEFLLYELYAKNTCTVLIDLYLHQ